MLQQLTKRVIEAALDGETDAHLGYGKHECDSGPGGNARNGRRSKTVLTEAGPVQLDVYATTSRIFHPSGIPKTSTSIT